jgi:hypothetical protein
LTTINKAFLRHTEPKITVLLTRIYTNAEIKNTKH